MPLVHMSDMLHHAQRHGYAVAAFHVANLEFLEGVLAAAEQSRAPVIFTLQATQPPATHAGLLLAATLRAAQRAEIPVAVDLDCGSDLAALEMSPEHGANGIIVDPSMLKFEDNLKRTRALVAIAQASDVCVEGQLGYVPTADERPWDPAMSTLPAEARAYVERSGVGCLSIAIGNQRGMTRGHPRLDYARLSKIRSTVDIPLAMHGGSGLSEDQCRKLVGSGIAKLHFSTLLTAAATRATRMQSGNLMDILAAMRQHIREAAEGKIRLLGGSGRAAEVLSQCRAWPCERAAPLVRTA